MEGLKYFKIERNKSRDQIVPIGENTPEDQISYCIFGPSLCYIWSPVYALGHKAAVALLWLISKDLGAHILPPASWQQYFFKKKLKKILEKNGAVDGLIAFDKRNANHKIISNRVIAIWSR